MNINVIQELKDELRNLRRERDILFSLAVNSIQESESITRDQAELKVARAIFAQLQVVPL